MDSKAAHMSQVTWQDVREDVARVNRPLFDIIEKISPSDEFFLYKCSYPFGSKLVEEGLINIPTADGRILPINSPEQPASILQQLGYSPIPLALVLQNQSELFYENSDRISSLMLFHPGHLFGIWETLDPPDSSFRHKMTTVTSGARSLFMLPKITDVMRYAKLRKEFSLVQPMPKTLSEQWPLLVELANHPDFPTPWFNDVLFFSEKWMLPRENDVDWLKFRLYLYEYAWHDSRFARNKMSQDVLWDCLSRVLIQKNLKVDPYLLETVKHLVGIGMGGTLGMRPSDGSKDVAPIRELQAIFVENYGLKAYLPTLMIPAHLTESEADGDVYYSFQYPTAPISLPAQRNVSTIMSKLREIRELIIYLQGELNLGRMSMYNRVKRVEYDFYHSEIDNYSEIKKSTEIALQDPRFTWDECYGNSRKFADTAPFFRGCIRIGWEKGENNS